MWLLLDKCVLALFVCAPLPWKALMSYAMFTDEQVYLGEHRNAGFKIH